MKIASIQMRVQASRVQDNLKSMLASIEENKGKADLIVFPELCVSGYFVGDLFFDADFIAEVERANERLLEASKGTAIVWGSLAMRDGKLYNAAYFAVDGVWGKRIDSSDAHYYTKHLLPNYTFFEDARYFATEQTNWSPFEFQGKRIALQICEDMWDANYDVHPSATMLAYDPDLIINISASPWIKGKEQQRYEAIQRLQLDIPFIYVNQVGVQNTGKNVVMFDGGSMIVDKQKVAYLPDNFTHSEFITDLSNFETFDARIDHKLLTGYVKTVQAFDEEALAYGPKWVVGVSGGLDSSVTVALLSLALGANRVLGVTMPSQFTRDITKSNAYHLSKNLGFELQEIPIHDMVDATVRSLTKSGYEKVEGLSYENIQARLRGHTLMSVSSLVNGVVSNNGNKIETALGYATLYGDAIGALSILGDLTKIEVGQLAEEINAYYEQEMIPHNLIPSVDASSVVWEFAPSAELRDDQFDPMKWGYHDALIERLLEGSLTDILQSYLDQTIYDTPMGSFLKSYGLDDGNAFVDDLAWVVKTMRRATYKRLQTPPIIAVSDTAFGTIYRESQLPMVYTEKQAALMSQIRK